MIKDEFQIPFIRIRTGKYLFLLISILLLFVIHPFMGGYIKIRLLTNCLFSLILISGIYASGKNRAHFVISLLIAIPLLVVMWLLQYGSFPFLIFVSNFLGILFFGFTAITVLYDLFSKDEVTFDAINGAICGYFLLGIM